MMVVDQKDTKLYNLKYLNKMHSMEEMNQNIKYHYL